MNGVGGQVVGLQAQETTFQIESTVVIGISFFTKKPGWGFQAMVELAPPRPPHREAGRRRGDAETFTLHAGRVADFRNGDALTEIAKLARQPFPF